ncbi:MAG: 2-amino-4-hydroxy-6-hydroxymethyldihydropteridine diphosphokinase [Bacteroidota bacterium]
MHQVFLSIGGNIGNKPENFRKVHHLIENELGTITKKSSVYETPPWGFSAKENFWNQVVQIKTELKPRKILAEIHEIENLFNRVRHTGRYTSREMDIDILFYDADCTENDELTIPHPKLHQRLFVLVPLAEIAPDFIHPLFKKSSKQLLEQNKDESAIKKVEVEF